MDEQEKAIKRLSKPAPLTNWARHNLRRLDDTRNNLIRFALVPPRHSLTGAYNICAEITYSGLSLDEALTEVEKLDHPVTRVSAREIIPAFHQYSQENDLDGIKELHGRGIPFPIGRAPDGSTSIIPVRPTFTVLKDGRLKPFFVIGWATLYLNDYQKKLLSTIICKSILTQQDYLDCDAQVLCLPRIKFTRSRRIQEWPARLYGTLSDEDLNEQFDRYGIALSQAIKQLRGE